ncbi:MAG TPA: HD domain-containing protein [Candidatus Saccharimonadales bacterium]|nr:HD domain-containing protein [Candidatus Saccharimonadales bacterium]
MNKKQIIAKTKDYVEQKFASDSSGHDWWHIYRVWRLAKHIAAQEKSADLFIVELAALLHDIADWKFADGDLETGPKAARAWLASLEVNEKVITAVEDIIRNVSFKGANVKSDLKTIEGQIVHDADKLDAIGAIGIARCFAFGGSVGNKMYDPAQKPVLHSSFDEYKKMGSSSITHFYEKLLLLKDRMFTETGRQMAVSRHEFMEKYLEEFYGEWDGKI